MVISVSISAEAESKLRAKAAAAGVDITDYAARTLEHAAKRLSLDEVLEPLRTEFEQSGMSEDELTELLEEVKHEARAERRAGRGT